MANDEWSPRIDISENDGVLLIKAEIPGVCKENVKVTMEKGCASIASSAPIAISSAASPCQTTWIANT
ncbi:MAG: HSP20 family molecular chaperone IbpA [Cyanobium sp.]|jgi:HSP20 family molecular chaperone IbpA